MTVYFLGFLLILFSAAPFYKWRPLWHSVVIHQKSLGIIKYLQIFS